MAYDDLVNGLNYNPDLRDRPWDYTVPFPKARLDNKEGCKHERQFVPYHEKICFFL